MDFTSELVGVMPSLKVYAIRLTRNLTDAGDLLQDTMVRALEKRSQFQPGTNLAAWLSTIMFRLFLTERRKANRRYPYEIDDAIDSPQHERVNAADTMFLLSTLPQAHQDAVLIVGALGHTYDEAAEILETNVGTVKSRVHRARIALHGLCSTA